MDSRIVTREIRREIWPSLKAVGFSAFTGRTAWRYTPTTIDVVNLQSFNSYIADGVGCTTYSFALNLGCCLLAAPRIAPRPVMKKGPLLRPQEYECHIRGRLKKRLRQPQLERTDTWFVDSLGENLAFVIQDARGVLLAEAPGWFNRWHDPQVALFQLTDLTQESDHEWGFGTPDSPIRNLIVGFLALNLGRRAEAKRLLTRARDSGSFPFLRDELSEALRTA